MNDQLNEMLEAIDTPTPTETTTSLLSDVTLPDMKAVRSNYGGVANAIAGTAATWDQAMADLKRIHEADGKRHDITGVDLSKARLRANGKLYLQTEAGEFALRRHALNQLCSAIGAPLSYLEDLPTKTAIKAIAWGLRTKPIQGKRRLRFAGDEIRGFVTDRYQLCDDLELFAWTAAAMKSKGLLAAAQVEQLHVGKRTGLRMSVGKPVKEGNPSTGLGARVGVGIGNGEIGNGSKKGSISLYVPWCTNGCSIAIGRFGFRESHLTKIDETRFIEMLCAILDEVPNMIGLTEKAAQDAFNLEELEARVRNLEASGAQRREIMVQTLAEAYGLYPAVDEVNIEAIKIARSVELELRKARTDEEKKAVATDVYDALGVIENCFNAWQLTQGVTAVGRDANTDEQREHLEELGGEVLHQYLAVPS